MMGIQRYLSMVIDPLAYANSAQFIYILQFRYHTVKIMIAFLNLGNISISIHITMTQHKVLLLMAASCLLMATLVLAKDKKHNYNNKDLNSKDMMMMRKSIVYDKKTPDVFYCPIQKPTGFDKLIVRYVQSYSHYIMFNK